LATWRRSPVGRPPRNRSRLLPDLFLDRTAGIRGAASAERIAKLIRQLGDKDYYVRQRAQEELARTGFEAFDALSTATTDEDLEIASRANTCCD